VSFGDDVNRILVATDGSPSAQDATDFGIALATAHEAELLFVHIVRTLDFVTGDDEDSDYALPHEPTERDHAVLEEAAERATERGVHATTSLRLGAAVDEIIAYAETCDVDLIVVGTRGHGRVARAILGSVSLGVLHKATRPVVVVRGGHPTHTATPSPRPATTA
jgi:nucleotide-binding universal stress UspA family protein